MEQASVGGPSSDQIAAVDGRRLDEAEYARVDICLDTWAEWMRGRGVHLGYPSRASGIAYPTSQDFEELIEAADAAVARMVDAAVDGLPYIERCAIAVRCRLMHRWPEAFESYAYAAVFAQARDQVRRFLAARGIE